MPPAPQSPTSDLRPMTIGLPVYNGEKYLAECIESILAQKHTDFRLIVVDDCSSDRSCEVVQGFKDPRIELHRNEHRGGLVGNWNRCLILADSKYVSIFHQDDVMLPGHLGSAVEALDQDEKIGMYFCRADVLGEEDCDSPFHYERAGVIEGDIFFRDLLYAKKNFVCCPGVVLRFSFLKRVGVFDESLPFTVDLEMWLRMAGAGRVCYNDAVSVQHRLHAGQETRRFDGLAVQQEEYMAKIIATKAAGQFREHHADLAGIYATRALQIAYNLTRSDKKKDAFRAMWWAIMMRPNSLLTQDLYRVLFRLLKK